MPKVHANGTIEINIPPFGSEAAFSKKRFRPGR